MHDAGLTHGGFYKHFDSRDQLVAEAVAHAFAESERAVADVTADQADPLGSFVDWYLSAEHRDNPGTGCGIVALGSDAARGGDAVQTAYREQVERYLAHLEELLGNRDNAAAALSQLVGAVHVARAIGPGELSDRILSDARASVVSYRA
jgi:TetR/AcrR family transcriptional repressor of nem operon